MSTRTIMWTALPNGVAPSAGHRLKLSVLVSPRLVTDTGSDGRLGDFPDFVDWPAVAKPLAFRVEIQGGPSFTAKPIVEPGFPGLDSAAWRALFPKTTLVHSYKFDDHVGRAVRSFPTKEVHAFIRRQYQLIAVHSGSQKPSLSQLGFDVRGERVPNIELGRLVLFPQTEKSINADINGFLESRHAVPPGVGSPLQDLYQVRLMHQPLSKVVRNADGTAKPLPPQVSPDVDFHKMVGAMGQYPKLMRALGLALDLEIAPDNVPPTGLVRVTPSLQGAPPLTPWTAYRFDGRRLFVAASGPAADIADGMLSFQGPDDYEVVQVDLDGAAEKVLDFVRNLSRVAYNEVASTIDTPERYGLPSLRSAGFSAARSGRAVRLVNTFQNARNNNVAAVGSPNASSVVLHADDVTRGYRIDVWDSMSSAWHSLCQRDGTYRLLNGPLTLTFSDEGFATVATTQSADGSSTDLRLPESLFRWAGWSLSVRRAGSTVGSDSTPQPAGNTASTDAKLETDFTVTKGTLPRLRFGALYQFRARAVDLAGNSLPPGAVLDDTYNIPPQPVPYQRYEPVVAPVVVLREPLGADTTPGESVERIVVRSNFDTHIAAVSERHIAPPKTAHDMAEAHGMLDTPAGPPDKALYATLVAKDGSLDVDAAHPDAPVPHAEAQLALPYLPDPCAVGAAFRTLPGDGPGVVRRIAFDGAWPDTRPFRIALDEGSGPPAFVENATERVLTVHLPKADVATVALSSYVTDRDTSQPPRILSTMAIWSWIVDANPPDLDALKRLALEGGHWMITPPRTLTLVHAVQKPLIEPQFQHLTSRKILGQTFATITDELPISGKSTIRLDIDAEWQETLDDMTSAPQPVIRPGSTRAFAETIGPTQTVAVVDGRHEFHDTRHRMVSYTAVATTRFREYFPPALTADPANLTRTSEPVEIAILSSARPASPRPLYVIPTFGWGSKDEGAWDFSRRAGGGLRVYLDRPWYSSGEGELLGAVLWGCEPPEHAAFRAFEVPDLLKGYVTQWGMDPIWNAPPPPSQAAPRPEHFRNAVAIGHGLTLDELADRPTIPLSVAGHSVGYDTDRKLWYCDIVMDPGNAYFPFVRLALARYQPHSVADAHLSRVVLADFIQLVPDRSASITIDPLEGKVLQLAVTGPTYAGPGASTMRATVQTQPLGSPAGAAWVPVGLVTLAPQPLAGSYTLWTSEITLPAARGSRPFRLVIEEFESFSKDVDSGQQRRLAYTDVIDL